MRTLHARACRGFQTVDRFNQLLVSAYITPGGARFLLLHDGRSDDTVRSFFTEVHDAYMRVRGLVTHGRMMRGRSAISYPWPRRKFPLLTYTYPYICACECLRR